MEYIYKKGDIVCVWRVAFVSRSNYISNPTLLRGFGKIISVSEVIIKIRWINKYRDKRIHRILKYHYTLLIKAKAVNSKEDWKSLSMLAKLKYTI